MPTSTKGNQTATPLTVQPGSPHWITPEHGLGGRGQGYDFHDPVSLQKAEPEGGYESGMAITQYGQVGFVDRIINVTHGMIYDLELIRKFGTMGTYDFWITWEPTSTGLLGDFRTDVEHGFDINAVDLDLATLNPSVSADPDGLPRVRVRMHDGQLKQTIKAIAPYRTNVRDFEPVVLQKPYTYWVKEQFNAYAGNNELELMKTEAPWDNQPDFLPGCETWAGIIPFKYEVQNLQLIDSAAFLNPASIAYEYRPTAGQHWAYYNIMSLPVPDYFIDPTLVGSPAVPGKESWKNDFDYYNHENLLYTVGNTRDCVAITRVYVHSQGGLPAGRTGAPDLDVLPCCKDALGRCTHDAKGSYFTRTPPWVGKTSFEPPHDSGIMGTNIHRASLTDNWTTQFEFKYSPIGEYSSGYESGKEFAFGADASDFWNHDYAGWKNDTAGDLMFLGQPPTDVKLDSGFNMIFNWEGTPADNNIANGYPKVCIDETRHLNLSGNAVGFDRVPYKTWDNWAATTDLDQAWVPFDNYNGRAGTPSTTSYPHGDDTIVGLLVNWYETRKQPVEQWAYHENTTCNSPGMGEGGTSNTLYDISSLMHDPATYDKNRQLKGYYKCCTDHLDREVKITISKVNENDGVGIDIISTQSTFINKSSFYDIGLHAQYDTTVQPFYGISPGLIFENFQAWDSPPVGPSLTDQLFVPIGAETKSPVLFLSLSAGALAGGTSPINSIPRVRPKSRPILRSSSKSIRETEVFGTTVTYNVTHTNVGGDIAVLSFDTSPAGGFRSTSGDIYGLVNSTGPTASGDKLDDFSWQFTGNPRYISGRTDAVHLSANESATVQYELTVNTMNPNGYNVWHGNQFDQGVLYGGVVNSKTSLMIVT